MNNKFVLAAALIAVLFVFSACSQTDVIGNGSIESLGKLIDAMPGSVTSDEINGGWSLDAPDGSARFIWSRDFSKSAPYDVMLETPAQPFIDAGLDISKLPQDMLHDNMIVVGVKLGTETLTYKGDASPLASYRHIVRLKPDVIGYHGAMDHYGVNLSNGNMFEWAKDMIGNDKDIVFVLDPQPFLDAGVDPEKIAGWVFAKVPTMDDKGNKIEVDKILKPFDVE